MLTDDGDGRRHRGRGRDRDWDDDRFAFGFGFGVGPFQGFYGRPWYSWYGPRWGGWYGPTFGYFGPWSGYYGYGWPYYAGDTYIGGNTYVGSAYYDPEAIEEEAAGRRESSTTEEAKGFQRRAEIAFREGRYDEAVRLANHAVVEMPNDGRLFLFLSQALFAVGDYGAAAGAAHHAMSASDEDDWGYVVENFQRYYGNGNDYTDQLRRLEKFTRENPDAPYARFLLGYHYGFLGHPKEARAELAEAAKLEGRDELAGELLVRFGGERPSRRSGEGMAEQDRDDDREIRQ
jgi:tetratricopeptide (TPR) repeat protein